MSEDRIFETIARVYTSLSHIEQNVTVIYIVKKYYRITQDEVYFLVKLYKIYYRKAYSKFKGPLKYIISIRLFERVQIDLINITTTPDGDFI